MSVDGRRFDIGTHRIGDEGRLFVIAEIGLNHDGSVERALALVDAAAAAGASAIKLQTVDAAGLVSTNAPAPAHVNAGSMVEFFAQFELDEAAHRAVVDRARAHGLAVLATPLSEAAVGLLERVGIDAYKIASGDITWPGLIARAAATGRPLIISTGMSDLHEISRAVGWARDAGATVFLSSHILSEVDRMCSRIGIVRAGRLVAVRTLAELRASAPRRVTVVFSTPVGNSQPLPQGAVRVSCEPQRWIVDITGPLGPLLATLAVLPVHDIGVAPFTVEDTVLRLYEEGTC